MNEKINKIEKITPKLIIIFLYIQPFLDILASVLIKNNLSSNITAGIRLLFMIYMIIYLVISKYKNKKKTLTYLSLLITCMIIHIITIYIFKSDVFLIETKTTLTTYYFIFLLISFYIEYKKNKFNTKHIKNILLIYLILTFIPNILNISYESYYHSKLGKTGWFYSANALGSIIIILLPIALEHILKLKPIYIIILTSILLYVIFSLGTKTPVLGLIILLIINTLYFIYKIIKNREKKKLIISLVLIISLITSSLLIIPKTSFYKNLIIHMNFIKKEGIEIKSKEFLDHFVFSERLTFEENTRKQFNNSSLTQKLFGIGYIENYKTEKEVHKIIEIDYFDIFYKEGIIGFILYFIPVGYILILSIKNTKLNFKSINYISSVLIIMLLALFQGHMFITPAVSIFVAIIFILNSIDYKTLEEGGSK